MAARQERTEGVAEMQGAGTSWRERRIRERTPVSWIGTLVHENGEESCAIVDFSPRGARVTPSSPVPVDRRVSLRLTAHGEFVGRIVWRNPEAMGLQFQHLEDVSPELRSVLGGPVRRAS